MLKGDIKMLENTQFKELKLNVNKTNMVKL